MSKNLPADPLVYRDHDLARFAIGGFFTNVGVQVQSVAIGWQLYALTHSTVALAMVGLCQFIPMFLLTLPAGELCDRFDQRRILAASLVVCAGCAALLLALTFSKAMIVWPYYAVLATFGAARGFLEPADSALLVFVVPPERLSRSIAINSSISTAATITGPALGGFLYAAGAHWTYSACAASYAIAAVLMITLHGRKSTPVTGDASRFERMAEGVRFVRHHPVILGAISLDLFAVLLGGATALLPVFARDILHVGPTGLGLLRSAPAAGAAVTALLMARKPLERHTGIKMFSAVGIFGIATIVFGLSDHVALSLIALFILGASDMVSVFIRTSLVQFATPDAMRGRVSAVNKLFVGASNELGEFESGMTASWFGTVPAVVIGGVCTLAVAFLWMAWFPPLRKVDQLREVAPTL